MIRLWDLVCCLNSLECSSQHAFEHCREMRTTPLLLKRGSKLAGFTHSSARSIQWKVNDPSRVWSVTSDTMWKLCDTRRPTAGPGDADSLFLFLDWNMTSGRALLWRITLVLVLDDLGRCRLNQILEDGGCKALKVSHQHQEAWSHCHHSTWPQADVAASLAEQLEARVWKRTDMVFATWLRTIYCHINLLNAWTSPWRYHLHSFTLWQLNIAIEHGNL